MLTVGKIKNTINFKDKYIKKFIFFATAVLLFQSSFKSCYSMNNFKENKLEKFFRKNSNCIKTVTCISGGALAGIAAKSKIPNTVIENSWSNSFIFTAVGASIGTLLLFSRIINFKVALKDEKW